MFFINGVLNVCVSCSFLVPVPAGGGGVCGWVAGQLPAFLPDGEHPLPVSLPASIHFPVTAAPRSP